MKTCTKCGASIAESTRSGYCRKCAQKLAVAKREETCLARYGAKNVMHIPEYVSKISETMLARYGVNCAIKVPEFREKYKSTMTSIYGVPYYVMSDEYLARSHFRVSKANHMVGEALNNAGIAFEYEFSVEDKQYDIRVVGTNLLIEVDPSYTHNVIGNHWTTTGIPEDYHKMKSAVAAAAGYRCIHVFDWDDLVKIVDMVRPRHKLYARNCEVRQLAKRDADAFLNRYHIQGSTRSSVLRYGLYCGTELVQVITLGRPRYNRNYDWELLRLCSKAGIQVLGGASKLFNYVLKLIGNASVISYCDLAKFTGEVYSALGMTLLRVNVPQEVWSKGSEKILGSTLRALGYDKLFNASFGKGTSNEELMIHHGWLPVYDCGQAVYVYNANRTSVETVPDTTSQREYYQSIAQRVTKSKERTCAFCGEPFIPASNRQRYCKRVHTRNCPVCGKEYVEDNVENLKRPPVACSYECRVAATRKTSLDRYGCVAPGNNPEARKKAKHTIQQKKAGSHEQ